MIHALYKTTNLVNSKFYLGVHTTEDIAFGCDNWEDPYVGSGHNIWAALKKYGRDKFQVEIVAYFDEEDYAYDAEKDIVTEEWLTTNKGVCYNINVGGNKPPKVLRWINNGKNNKRIKQDDTIPAEFVEGRIFQFSDKELEVRRLRRIQMNKDNNPMSNVESKKKMTDTINRQYQNGRRPHNAIDYRGK